MKNHFIFLDSTESRRHKFVLFDFADVERADRIVREFIVGVLTARSYWTVEFERSSHDRDKIITKQSRHVAAHAEKTGPNSRIRNSNHQKVRVSGQSGTKRSACDRTGGVYTWLKLHRNKIKIQCDRRHRKVHNQTV